MEGDDFLEFKQNLENRIKTQADSLFEEKKSKEVFNEVKKFLEEENQFIKYLHESSKKYDILLNSLNLIKEYGEEVKEGPKKGIIALNGTSGVGQSYVMKFINKELNNRNISFKRIHLLATRSPRSNEGDKDPYIFTKKENNHYECIFSNKKFSKEEIYLEYESRPGAHNAILKKDIAESKHNLLYLETVIPTLLKMKNETNGYNIQEDIRIVYLAADSGKEWVYRLVAREPDKIINFDFREKIIGRINSSLTDMELAAKEQIPSVIHVLDYGQDTAKKVLTAWNILK